MALTGYNFPSLAAIKPYLEPAGTGRSAIWARETAQRLRCTVCVGYPEIEAGTGTSPATYYNSLIVVDETGAVVHNYRKSFLYFTDETWAAEGKVEHGFHELTLPRATDSAAPRHIPTSFGICMDINPYKFEAPYTAYEFAHRVLDSRSQLVVLSMAWLTALGGEQLAALGNAPDMDTFSYWLNRFMPLLETTMGHTGDVDGYGTAGEPAPRRVILVFANRAGEEPAADDTKPPARYAGTSAVVAVTQRPRTEGSRGGQVAGTDGEKPFDVKILCWDLLGACQEGICFADTTAGPKMVFGLKARGSNGSAESDGSDE
ncbi:hypothetical protein N7462_003801 [Penicillium macrosclerotiorum]|uniref:uncharacterized protein n=1 Tax=Penicillium macrosclerotiorum TaxID=303699 RepID=UPI0025470FEB|nr:uncharacterized protein N7462_003801 [Penicillium macrosclerotiorum]KAJ5689409.1 hypothetical protein N7462_003801 [Penicillium macrosclerotiorum]